MKEILNLLKDNEAVLSLDKKYSSIVSNEDTIEAILIASSFNIKKQKLVIVKDNLYNASRLYDRLASLVDNDKLLFFPSDESFQIEALAGSKELLINRIETLYKLTKLDSYILIIHTASMIRYLPNKEDFINSSISIKVNSDFNRDLLIDKLIDGGYERVNFVSGPLEFSTRGGVVDIYSLNNSNPIRIEFFGDEVDSIREFDITTQRTINKLKSVDILPATDLVFNHKNIEKLDTILNFSNVDLLEDNMLKSDFEALQMATPYHLIYKYYKKLNDNVVSILNYLDDAHFVYCDLSNIKDNFNFIVSESNDYFKEESTVQVSLYHNLLDMLNSIKNYSVIKRFKESEKDIVFNLRDVENSHGNFKTMAGIIKNYLNFGYKIVLVIDNKPQLDCLNDVFIENGFKLNYKEKDNRPKERLSYTFDILKEGFDIVDEHIVYLSSYELFNIVNKGSKYAYKFKTSESIDNIDSLEVNDYVVHEDYGIGRYVGLEIIEVNGIKKDYLNIKYANDGALSIPVENFNKIRKYVSRDGATPKLSNLNGKEWSKTKARIKERIKDLSEKLMELYINRTKDIGFAFAPDEEYQVEFENAFPYQLTSDQERAVKEIKTDMESTLPMDRLLCGDVGFGKTEVAFRAAFKAIINNKQVAILCPTTLLARQHFKVAQERFKNFPINIQMVSRLVSTKEINKIFKDTKDGKVNLLIGTHKLLNKELKFKDLGLLIIDEEQRFGVADKEKIKEIKQGIDVLTLSATPIPRTLQSSLIGIRQLSQIETPIENRLSVQTYVLERNIKLAKEIIMRELSRNGQVYYIHNNIDTIRELEMKLKALMPNVRIDNINGRMDKEIIENTMLSFIEGKIDVLISTTIIENGIDISNANTIIIDDADKFGLSQLYQLKGRVGRSEKLGYCYLFYSPNKELTDTAKKRLKAIKEFSSLGSGYRIALRDLTIRGAGDILGKEQAGFIDSVGIDLYLRLLQESINEQKYGKQEEVIINHKNLKVSAYIPEKFSSDDIDKIDIYKRINDIKTITDLIKFNEELNDIYGKIPESVKMLIEKRRLELFIFNNTVDDIVELDKKYELVLSSQLDNYEGIGEDIFKIVNQIDPSIQITYYNYKIRLRFDKSDNKWLDKCNNFLTELDKIIYKYKNRK